MSYILDALKKSEQERGHGTAPGIQTTHSSSLNYYSNKTHWWPYALVFLIAINLAALLYFVLLKDDMPGNNVVAAQVSTTDTLPVTDPAVSLTQSPAPQTPARQVHEEAPVSMANAEPSPVQVEPVIPPAEISPATSSDQSSNQVSAQSDITAVDRDELPYDIKQHIPIMEFSAHVYSTNPMQRSIVINGRFMEEGDNLGSDLVLNEITPQGAVFDFQGYRFHQGVVSSWN